MSSTIKVHRLGEDISGFLKDIDFDRFYIITDSNVKDKILDKTGLMDSIIRDYSPYIINFPAGEENKNIGSVCEIWKQLSNHGATRRSLILNIGGGVTTDMGGFAASTFKRGIRYINFPTTLLAMVDASVGGKTGIDFAGLKNEIGTFAFPETTIIYPPVLQSLSYDQTLSGMGEVVKMTMIRSKEKYVSLLKDFKPTEELILDCIEWKRVITDEDPREGGIRKLLNFGHSAAHAFESILTERNCKGITHGQCVAHGIMIALLLSHFILSLPSWRIYEYREHILSNYTKLPLSCKDREMIIDKIKHDKKNVGGVMKFVLLRDIAAPEYDVTVSTEDLSAALDIYFNS